MTSTDRKELIASIKYLIEGHRNTVRVITTDLMAPERVNSKIAALEKQIEAAQREMDQLRTSLAMGPQIIKDTQQQIQKLLKELRVLENLDKIEKLRELVRDVNFPELSDEE